MKYGQELPKEIEDKLDAYIKRIKAIKWFKPSPELKKDDVSKQVNLVLEAFGVKASIEYRELKTVQDWGAAWGTARDAAWDAAWGTARDAAWDAARGAAWGTARDAAWDAAWDAARGAACDAAWGAAEVISSDLEAFTKKYPNAAFLNLIQLWESGLYPFGVVDGKFIVYVPAGVKDFEE